MSLWRTQPNIEQLNAIQKNTIGEVLDIRFESFDDESLTASIVVDHRTHQPYGLLHGGARLQICVCVGRRACVDRVVLRAVCVHALTSAMVACVCVWVGGLVRGGGAEE